MKVLHTITELNKKSGGPTTCTYYLISALRNIGVTADILTFEAPKGDQLIANDSFIHTVFRPRESKLAYSGKFLNFLKKHDDYQLYHINGLWQYPAHCSAKYARKHNKSYIITPHGMLYPDALKYSKWIKRLFLKLWFWKDIKQATCIHATCMQEMRYLRDLKITTPVAIIPNPIEIEERISSIKTKKQIGFIGRFHSIKNIETLIDAFIEVGNKEYELVLIGSGDAEYENLLRAKASKVSNIVFKGFLDGKEKDETLSALSYLVLPSQSENFGMVVAESLVREVPVIASKGTPWEDLNTYDCGWWVDNDVESLASAIRKAIELPETMRKQMGRNGRELIIKSYSTEVVSHKMMKLYDWILNKGEKPDFVYEYFEGKI